MGTIADFVITRKNRLGHWEGMMEEWIIAIEKFTRLSSGDAPYWYNERANIGILSASAWRAGSIALEEFQHRKIDIENVEVVEPEREEVNWSGRCDLWIGNGKKSELIEAKFKWLNMASEKLAEFAECQLEIAMKDAKNSRSDNNVDAVGVAFLPLSVKPGRINEQKTVEQYIEESIKVLLGIDADLIAWCFPVRVRGYVDEKYGYQLPGIVMLAKKI